MFFTDFPLTMYFYRCYSFSPFCLFLTSFAEPTWHLLKNEHRPNKLFGNSTNSIKVLFCEWSSGLQSPFNLSSMCIQKCVDPNRPDKHSTDIFMSFRPELWRIHWLYASFWSFYIISVEICDLIAGCCNSTLINKNNSMPGRFCRLAYSKYGFVATVSTSYRSNWWFTAILMQIRSINPIARQFFHDPNFSWPWKFVNSNNQCETFIKQNTQTSRHHMFQIIPYTKYCDFPTARYQFEHPVYVQTVEAKEVYYTIWIKVKKSKFCTRHFKRLITLWIVTSSECKCSSLYSTNLR